MHIKPNLQPLKINFQSLPIQPNFIFNFPLSGAVCSAERRGDSGIQRFI
nr:MAG TPA: hypothetical protein [Caudoviricetes sp.]DAY93583.1 MAG TPA: hypothetical protein [Caudoviricetes sp.]